MVSKYSAIAGLWILSGCMSGPTFMQQSSESKQLDRNRVDAKVITQTDGIVTGQFEVTSTEQTMAADEASAVRGSSITVPPNSLAIATSITLEEGAAIALDSIVQSTTGNSTLGIASASNAVMITSSVPVDLPQPMTVALALPPSSGLVNVDLATLSVVYKVFKAAENVWMQGIYPRDQLTVKDGEVLFESRYFGTFQIVFLTAPAVVTTVKEIPAEAPALSKVQERALPDVVWSGVKGSFSRSDRSIIVAAAVNGLQDLAQCVVVGDRDRQPPFDLRTTVLAVAPVNFKLTSASADDFYFRWLCEEKNGRMSQSEWSEKVSVPVYDIISPTVAVSAAAAVTGSATFPVTVAFSERVDGFTLSDVIISNGIGKNLNGNGTSFTLQVSPAGQGAVTVRIPAGAAADLAGNTSQASNTLTVTFDSVRPMVTLVSGATGTISTSPFTIAATFAEPVTGLDISDITTAGVVSVTIAGSGAAYTLTVIPSGAPTLSVSIAAGAAVDAAGNPNTVSNTVTHTVDGGAPGVTLSASSSSPTSASSFPVTVVFTESVTGFTDSDISVSNATLSGFSGTGATYSVMVSPSADGDVTVGVAAGVAVDSAGNANTDADDVTVKFDTTAPSAPADSSISVLESGSDLTLFWNPASDTTTSASALKYAVCNASTSAAAASQTDCAASTLALTWTEGATDVTVADLDSAETYHFNVMVRDQAGNVTLYTALTHTMSDFVAPTPGALTVSNVRPTSFTIGWTQATDDVTAQNDLQYYICMGTALVHVEARADCMDTSRKKRDWTIGPLNHNFSSLAPNTKYFVRLLVRDASGNEGSYPILVVPTVPEVTTTTQTAITGNTRRSFYDAAHGYHWQMHLDGSNVKVRYSIDGRFWSDSADVVLSDSSPVLQVEYKKIGSEGYVFLAYDEVFVSGGDTYKHAVLKRGKLQAAPSGGVPSIAWDPSELMFTGTTSEGYQSSTVKVDANNKLWFAATRCKSGSCSLRVRKSVTTADASSVTWESESSAKTFLGSALLKDVTLLPLASGNLMVIYRDGMNLVSHLWNGSGWTYPDNAVQGRFELASDIKNGGSVGEVRAIAKFDNAIYVGGLFDSIGGVPVYNLAKWNGYEWFAVGFLNGPVNALLSQGGRLIIGGAFTDVGGDPGLDYLTSYSAGGWSYVEGATGDVPNGPVLSLVATASDLFVGGTFTNFGGLTNVGNIAKMSLATQVWSTLGSGTGNAVSALAYDGSAIYAGGASSSILKWNGSGWVAMGTVAGGGVSGLTPFGSSLYAGGSFSSIGAVAGTSKIAAFDGTNWSGLAGIPAGTVHSMAVHGASMYIAGNFVDGVANPIGGLRKLSDGLIHEPGFGGIVEGRKLFSDGQQLYIAHTKSNPVGALAFSRVGPSIAANVMEFSAAINSSGDPVVVYRDSFGNIKSRTFGISSGTSAWTSAVQIVAVESDVSAPKALTLSTLGDSGLMVTYIRTGAVSYRTLNADGTWSSEQGTPVFASDNTGRLTCDEVGTTFVKCMTYRNESSITIRTWVFEP